MQQLRKEFSKAKVLLELVLEREMLREVRPLETALDCNWLSCCVQAEFTVQREIFAQEVFDLQPLLPLTDSPTDCPPVATAVEEVAEVSEQKQRNETQQQQPMDVEVEANVSAESAETNAILVATSNGSCGKDANGHSKRRRKDVPYRHALKFDHIDPVRLFSPACALSDSVFRTSCLDCGRPVPARGLRRPFRS